MAPLPPRSLTRPQASPRHAGLPRLPLPHAAIQWRNRRDPNEPEVEEALGISIGADGDKLLTAGRTVLDRMKLQSLVITRGRDGMVAFERQRAPVQIPIYGSDEVTDVTGAGDTVIATSRSAGGRGAIRKRRRAWQTMRAGSWS